MHHGNNFLFSFTQFFFFCVKEDIKHLQVPELDTHCFGAKRKDHVIANNVPGDGVLGVSYDASCH